MDVVVPFRGDRGLLEDLRARLGRLRLRSGDTIVIVDNTPGPLRTALSGDPPVPVLYAADRSSAGYARNRGAERGDAEWIVFIDADTEPSPELLDRYFEPAPEPQTVLLAGGVVDEEVPIDAPAPARYAYLRNTLGQGRSLSFGRWGFVQTSNLACRRSGFESVHGFREDIRAAEDADLSYRLKAAGGQIERREPAFVVHRSRRSLRPFIRQAALYGAGAAWLSRKYPGAFPARRRPGLMWWAIRWALKCAWRAARDGDRDQLVLAFCEPLWELAFEFGRSQSIDLPPRPGG